jgi:HlyD family secretion protein
MRNGILFGLSVAGALSGLLSAYVYAIPKKPLPPAFNPASNPFAKGIFANGIVESYQPSGENTNIYPEVSGTIVRIDVHEGDHVEKGAPLFSLDDSVQRGIAEQQRAQAEAARAMLEELRAEPRRETLAVAKAQVGLAAANLKSANDSYQKQKRSYEIAPESVSRDTLDAARNATSSAEANLEVVTRQYRLTKAGAWIYDIRNQERQYDALTKAYAASSALLAKYTVVAPADGIVLSIGVAVGSSVSPQGTYNTYTQAFGPVLVMGRQTPYLAVRCYVDEILIPKLSVGGGLRAEMTIRGTSTKVPLEFVRVQPYVSPKIQLSNERTERVDVRVLPIVFRFVPPAGMGVYPGQLVDVYMEGK